MPVSPERNIPVRIVSIRHRVKKTAAGQARPTQLAIKVPGKKTRTMVLKEEADELDWVRGRYPTSWRLASMDDDLDEVFDWHQKWRKRKESDNVEDAVFNEDRSKVLVIPKAYDGFTPGDTVVMTLGGSGGNLAKGLIKRGKRIGAHTFRIPPYQLKKVRGEFDDKSDDPLRLIELFEARPELFYLGREDDLNLIEVAELYTLWAETQETRKACQLRLFARSRGEVFRETDWEDGPVGQLEDEFAKLKANSPTLRALLAEEKELLRVMSKALHRTEIFTMVLGKVTGLGPSLGGRLVAAIGDHRRFIDTEALNEVVASYPRSQRNERDGGLERDKVHVMDAWRAFPENQRTRYKLIQLTAAWQHEYGKSRETKLLELALGDHRMRARVRKKMGDRLKSFCGVSVLYGGKHGERSPDKQFVRARTGETTAFHRTSKQALFLLGEQFNYRPTTEWGAKLLVIKARLRAKHPHKVLVKDSVKGLYRKIEQVLIRNGVIIQIEDLVVESKADLLRVLNLGGHLLHKKTRDDLIDEISQAKFTGKLTQLYGNGHILRMAIWRTVTRFVEWLARELHMLEERKLMTSEHPETKARAA